MTNNNNDNNKAISIRMGCHLATNVICNKYKQSEHNDPHEMIACRLLSMVLWMTPYHDLGVVAPQSRQDWNGHVAVLRRTSERVARGNLQTVRLHLITKKNKTGQKYP